MIYKMIEQEIWKSVGIVKGIDFTGCYEVSNFGHVKSLRRRIRNKDGIEREWNERILKPHLNPNGYPFVFLHKDGKKCICLVHRLVLQAFEPNPNPEIYTCINHKDETPTNNRLDNLEWCTPKYNSNYGTARERGAKATRERFIPIVQLDFNGEIINVYYSTKELNDTGIYKAWEPVNKINNRKYIYKNYFWIRLDKYNELTQDELLDLINKVRNEQRSLNSHKKFVVLLDIQGGFIKQFDMVKEAAEYLKCSSTSVCDCLKGKTKTVRGYKCMYLKDYQKQNNNEQQENI